MRRLIFSEYGEDVFGEGVLYWGTDFVVGIILVFWRSLRFWVSEVGEVVVVLYFFLMYFVKFGCI